MKYFICLFLVGIAVSVTAMNMKMQKLAEECGIELGVDVKPMIDLANSTDHYDHKPWKKLFESHDFRCVNKCMTLKMGLMNDEGECDIPKFKETFKFSDENIEVLTNCIGKNKQEDLCDRISEIQDCFWSV